MEEPTLKHRSDGLPGPPHSAVQVEYCTILEGVTDYSAGALNPEANGWCWI